MVNPYTGEVRLVVDGRPQVLKLTLGALAELEARLEADSLADLVARFEGADLRAQDVLHLICAGLRGGGWQGDLPDLVTAEIEGGPVVAAQAAARALALAFRGAA
jgi:hypothetical protein